MNERDGCSALEHDLGPLRRAWLCGAVGLAFGLVQSFLGFVAGGAGHGCFVPMGLESSPLGLTGNVLIAFCGGPVLWAVLGGLAGAADNRRCRLAFISIMAAHYLALLPILSDPMHFGDWAYLPKAREAVFLDFGIYAAGQFFLWTGFTATCVLSARSLRRRRRG